MCEGGPLTGDCVGEFGWLFSLDGGGEDSQGSE